MAEFPILSPIYQPAIRQIAAITPSYVHNELLLLIETTQDHLYNDGLIVRLDIPLEYQAQQLNQKFSEIIVNSATTFTMIFESFVFDPFVIPGSPEQIPLTIPIAENVFKLNSAVHNVLP